MHQTVRVRNAVDNLEVHHHWLQVTTRRGLGQSGFRDISPAFVQTRTASAKNVNLHSLQMVVDGRCQRGQDQATPYIVWATTQCTGMKNTLAL